MRWPFGPPHLTLKLKPSKKKTKKTKKYKTKKKKTKKKQRQSKKHKNTKKRAFQLSVKIFFFGGVSKYCLFRQLGPENAHPQNTIKIGVSAYFFLKSYASRNGHFWTKKTQIQKFQLSFFFFCFFSLSTTKNTKISWNPYFYCVLTNPKKSIFKI